MSHLELVLYFFLLIVLLERIPGGMGLAVNYFGSFFYNIFFPQINIHLYF